MNQNQINQENNIPNKRQELKKSISIQENDLNNYRLDIINQNQIQGENNIEQNLINT